MNKRIRLFIIIITSPKYFCMDFLNSPNFIQYFCNRSVYTKEDYLKISKKFYFNINVNKFLIQYYEKKN